MRPNLILRPPVVVLPLPSPEMLRVRVVLCVRRRPSPVRSRLGVPTVVRLVVKAVAAILWPLRRLLGEHARRQCVLAVEGGRPPPVRTQVG